MNLRDWINALDLACPYLKYDRSTRSWIALKEDPCLACDNTKCPFQGKPFPRQDDLIIINMDDEAGVS